MNVASYQAVGSIQPPRGYQKYRNAFLKLSSSNLKFDANRAHYFHKSIGMVESSSQTSVFEPVVTPSNGTSNELKKKSRRWLWSSYAMAIEAGKRICNIPVDMIYTSALIRAQMTAMLAMTQHRRKKVPIVLHDENEHGRAWTQIFSEETKKQSIPVIRAWQLNERMYGELQGLNKQETADKYGKEKVHEWRRSFDIPSPNGESLEMCAERAVAYFRENIEPQLQSGKNTLRSIIMYLDKLTSEEVISLELATGIPILYIFKEGKFTRRGSPAGPAEAGVYAYTTTLAKYRQKLDEI